MLWDDTAREEFAAHLAQMGLQTCPVCSGTTLTLSPAPVLLPWRGPPWIKPDDQGHDPKANILFMFMVTCEICAHVLLFNSERFIHTDRPLLAPE